MTFFFHLGRGARLENRPRDAAGVHATARAEWLARQGKRALVVFEDKTRKQVAQSTLVAALGEGAGVDREASYGGESNVNDPERDLEDMLAEHGDYEGVLDELLGSEPIGSCDECGTNLYADDVHHVSGYGEICGQCAWWARLNGLCE